MIAQLFAHSAKTYPDQPAICIESGVLTYSEVSEIAARITSCLRASTKDGQSTCILATRRTFTGFSGILGILGAGKVYVPVSPVASSEWIISITPLVSPVAIIADYEGFDLIKTMARESIHSLVIILPDHSLSQAEREEFNQHKVYDKSDLLNFSKIFQPVNVSPTSLAYILLTSGTTGEPKGVPIRQESVIRYVQSMASLYPVSPNDRCTQLFELTFDLSVHDMFVTWNAGACLFIPHRGKALFSADLVESHELTVWFSVPSVVSELKRSRRLKPGAFPSLRLVLFCGERLPTELAQSMKAAAPNALVVNIYGPTEATIAFTHFAWGDKEIPEIYQDLPIGYPLPEQQVFLLDVNRQPVPPNTVGEMYLAGIQVSDGYWKNLSQTKARYHKLVFDDKTSIHAYATGDLAVKVPDLGLMFRGRIDDQVKLHGVRIELGAIEAAVRRVNGGQQVVAIVWPQNYPSKLIVYMEEGDVPVDSIFKKCCNLLPQKERPDEIIAIDRLPLTTNGKLDRKKLVAMYEKTVVQVANNSTAKQRSLITDKEVRSAVYFILSKQRPNASLFLPRFKPDEDLIEHTDSFGFINMILALEEKFSVNIEDWRAVTRLDKLVAEVMKVRDSSVANTIEDSYSTPKREEDEPIIQRGLQNVILDYSSISSIDGKNGLLSYCGIPIDKLVGKKYIDIVFKLLHDQYPTDEERVFVTQQFRLGQVREAQMTELTTKIFKECSSPTKFVSSVIPLFQEKLYKQNAPQWVTALRLQGFVSATICRHAIFTRGECKFRSAIKQSLPVWVLESLSGRLISDTEKKAIESLFVMLAECITNPGTFAARIATSTDADYESSVLAALSVFSGSKHGGSTDDVMAMINDIGSLSRVADWVKAAQKENRFVPGFGHRVFQVPDPRVALIADWIDKLTREGVDATPVEIVAEVTNIMKPLRRHGTYVNVDAYTGALLTMLGVPIGYGTLVFMLARMAGWNAHVQEQKLNNIMINPLISYRPRQTRNSSSIL